MATDTELAELRDSLSDRVRGRDLAFLLDIHGVLVSGGSACGGAIEFLRVVRHERIPFCAITNLAWKSRQEHSWDLCRAGIEFDPSAIFTPCTVANTVLCDLGLGGARVLRVGTPGFQEELESCGVALADEAVDVVVVPKLPPGSPDIVRIKKALSAGATLVATSTDKAVPTASGGIVPGVGATLVELGIEDLDSQPILGKPNPAFLRAVASLGLPGGTEPIVVGDNPETDLVGACAAGMPAILIVSSITKDPSSGARPLCRLPRVSDLASVLGGLGVGGSQR